MPNHCENSTVIWGSPADVAEVVRAMTDAESEFGFSISQLVPMPEGLKGTTASFTQSTHPSNWDKMLAEGKWTQEEYEQAVADHKAEWDAKQARIDQFGYGDWYDWACAEENWGTKWGDYCHCGNTPDLNALEASEAGKVQVEFQYDTAWSPFSESFWQQVSNRFPKVRFETRYQEPGMGFAGVTVALQGIVVDESTDNLPNVDWESDDGPQEYCDKMCDLLDRLYDLADLQLAHSQPQSA